MEDFVNTIDLFGDEATASAIIERLITEYNDDKITSIGRNAFTACSALTSISLPSATVIEQNAFNNCSALTSVSLPSATVIEQNAFNSCYVFNTLVLGNDALCTLGNTSAFSSTSFRGYGGKTGTVYVPSDLISQYQNATNWSTLYAAGTCNFVAIEGSEYE